MRGMRRVLAVDTRGAVLAEYLVITATVGLTVAAAAATVGAPLIAAFRYAVTFLILPVP